MKAASAEQARARQRQGARRGALTAHGAPVGPKERSGTTGLGYIADQLQPREWRDIATLAERIGFLECLVASGSVAGGGMSLQLQVLPAYAHEALDLVQRSNQGVVCLVAFQVPWTAFLPDQEPDDATRDADDWHTDEWDVDEILPVGA